MQFNFYEIYLQDERVFFLPEKAMYFPEMLTLVIADWHLGKSTHFRKKGIFIPQTSVEKEFSNLRKIIAKYPTERIILLGDLFHSEWNEDWELFKEMLEELVDLEIILTRGNHDIIDFSKHGVGNIEVVDQYLLKNKFMFAHEPIIGVSDQYMMVTGHVHPGALIPMKGKQSYKFPCFLLEGKQLIIPAFGELTGLYILPKTPTNRQFLVVADTILEWTK